MQTLAEHKAETLAEDEANAALTDTPPQEVDVKPEEAADLKVVEDEADKPDEDADPDDGEAEEPETEAWMQTGSDEKKFTDGDVGAAKKKLRAKLEGKHNDETEKLKAEIAELKSSGGAPKELNKPKRSEFANADDPDDAYTDALVDWKLTKHTAATAASTTKATQNSQRQARQDEIDTGVEAHYSRADELTAESGIEGELYHAADLAIRTAVESVFPNQGELITNGFIANLGPGSEKVFYNLGVNKAKRAEFVALLMEDKTGLKASVFLGTLKAELTSPERRTTRAPKPAPTLTGDGAGGASGTKEQKKYNKAHASGNAAEAWKLRRTAKKAGVDTSTW